MGKHNDSAVAAVVEKLNQGIILTAHNGLQGGNVTVGPYHAAVDDGMRFGVFGSGRISAYKGEPVHITTRTAEEAAQGFVNSVGHTRAREAAKAHKGE